MKGTFAILLIAGCLLFPGNIATGSALNELSFSNCPNCVYCHLSPAEIIEKAAGEAEIPFERAWDDYLNNHNTITPVPCGWRVTLCKPNGDILIIDIIDDL